MRKLLIVALLLNAVLLAGRFWQEFPVNAQGGGAGMKCPPFAGDANGDGNIDLPDAQYLLNFLFLGGREPPCLDAADANDTGTLDVTTALYLFGFLFLGGPPPPPPGIDDCGADPTADCLGCTLLECP